MGLLSFSAVSAEDNATGDIVCAEEAPVMEQITAEEIGCEGNVATSSELQNSTLNPDSILELDENPDGNFIAMESEYSGNLLTDGCSTAQGTHDLYGIVDLGSNVMSLSIIEEENGKLEFILSDNRESITATYKEGNVLTQEGIDRLIMLLNDFDGIMDSNNVTVKYFFATASLRKLDNCGFLANNAYGNGGALYFKTIVDVTIENTIFNFNDAAGNGGAVYFSDVSDSNTFRDTQFLNNAAEIGDGGAIYFFRNLTNGVFDNVTFMNNFAGNGGAINMDRSTESTLSK